MVEKLEGAQLGMRKSAIRASAMEYTQYAMRQFYNKCVKMCGNYIVTDVAIVSATDDLLSRLQPPISNTTAAQRRPAQTATPNPTDPSLTAPNSVAPNSAAPNLDTPIAES